MQNTVVIDCFPESALRYGARYAIVAVDVIRATTTIATAVSMGRRCFSVASVEAALQVSARLTNPLLAGELGGVVPRDFEMGNSPADLALRKDIARPLVLLSSSGTKLIHLARAAAATYIGAFRNFEFLAKHLAGRHPRIAVIGAGSRGEFRREDQMCCAWIAERLMDSGYVAENPDTLAMVKRWRGAAIDTILAGASAKYLMRTGQDRDLDFILSHIADLDWAFALDGGEIVGCTSVEPELAVTGKYEGLPQ